MRDILTDIKMIADSLWQGMNTVLESFQTLIGGGLAFLGVVLTIFVSGRRLRKQLKHAARLDERRHKRELAAKRISLRDALSAEISIIASFLRDEQYQLQKWIDPSWKTLEEIEEEKIHHSDQTDDGRSKHGHRVFSVSDSDSRETYRFSMPERDAIYKALAGQISSLAQPEIIEVILAHDRYRKFTSWVHENCTERASGTDVYTFHSKSQPKLLNEIANAKLDLDRSISRLNQQDLSE